MDSVLSISLIILGIIVVASIIAALLGIVYNRIKN